HHFIGKDIINFHCLFWPAALRGAGYRVPTKVHTHGFITVDGVQMSKSRGTFINASTYLEYLDPEYLRYYFATKLAATSDDVDIQLDDFVQRVNSDLVGKVVNIASRCAGFIHRGFDGELSAEVHDPALWEAVSQARYGLAELYERGDFGRAVREITALADRANQYIAEHEPWKHVNDPARRDEVQGVCSLGINVFRALVVYLKPILPAMAAKAEAFLKVEPLAWDDAGEPLVAHEIDRFKPLFTRIDRKDVDKVVAATAAEAAAEVEADAAHRAEEESPEISIDDFHRVDLRVAKVLEANFVDGADKLIELRVDLGDTQRTVFAGVRAAYDPKTLVGRLVVVVANLAPRKMRFGISEGMVLAAGPGGEDIFLVTPDAGAEPGMQVT
ncbi:MAG: methionine--tRNA ligase subunit beta, partial [Gammaproteobacteria bacterium]|nr:methionine--tRNA ligase subunit beta [Gammaproteobacteria bacterium]